MSITYRGDGTLRSLTDWVDDETRLNAANMKAIGKAIIDNQANIKKIIGTTDDLKTDLTLNGVKKHADAIETALSFLADKDLIAKNPSLSFKSTTVKSYEVGTTIQPYNMEAEYFSSLKGE